MGWKTVATKLKKKNGGLTLSVFLKVRGKAYLTVFGYITVLLGVTKVLLDPPIVEIFMDE